MPMVFSPGLCTFISFKVTGTAISGGSGSCLDVGPGPINFGNDWPPTNLDAAMLIGVTALPATAVRVEFTTAAPALTVATATSDSPPCVSFFAVDVRTYSVSTVTALDKNGMSTAPGPDRGGTDPLMPAKISAMSDDGAEASDIDSHLAFGGLVASVQLSEGDWQHLLDKGYVTVQHHRDTADGDSIIELTIKR